MPPSSPPHLENIALDHLRPTQLTAGLREVKHKRKRLQSLEKCPGELVAYILETPIRAVHGPAGKTYVIDHHHLALAMIKENFLTAPMQVVADYSDLSAAAFWKKMQAHKYVHLVDEHGHPQSLRALPKNLRDLRDDPYRSLAGFVRTAGGFTKTSAPFAEFQWADFFRQHIKESDVAANFRQALTKALRLATHRAAAGLPGYMGRKHIRKI